MNKFLQKLLIPLNLITLVLQLVLMGSLGFWDDFLLFRLVVPLICILNIGFFTFWLFQMQWPFFMFIIAFFFGINEWKLLYQFPSNAVHISNGLKVMSFNVRVFNHYKWIDRENVAEEIQHFIRTESPDVICFQEYSTSNAPEFEEYPYRYFHSSDPNGKIGQSIFSKKKLFNSGAISFESSSNGGIYSDIILGRDTLRIYNVHFESLRIGRTDTLTMGQNSSKLRDHIRKVFNKQKKQSATFKAFSDKQKKISILCTDLNNTSFSKVYHELSENRTDAFVASGSGFGATFRYSIIPFRIDFIFIDKRMRVYDFKTHRVRLSDHEPISATIGWR